MVFVIQIAVDFLAARFGRRLSYRLGCVWAHVFATAGLVSMGPLPQAMPNPYVGLVTSVVLLSVGGGFGVCVIFPVLLLVGLVLLRKRKSDNGPIV